jgi:hypothetical protein
MTAKIISYLSQNKRRIAKGLYLLGALVEQMPDPDMQIVTGRLASRSLGEGGTLTIADQIKPRRRRPRNGRRIRK